jgi:hypothetical protein
MRGTGKTNLAVNLFTSSFESVLIRTQREFVRAEMVAAGFAVLKTGRDALQTYPDPASGQPFKYTETSNGFELESVLLDLDDEPIRLRFRWRGLQPSQARREVVVEFVSAKVLLEAAQFGLGVG